MARSAKRAKGKKTKGTRPGVVQRGAVAVGDMVSRNPVLVGGSTAFLVTLFYVSANALWYQPFPHSSAFFATRNLQNFPVSEPVEPETTINIVRPDPAARPEPPRGDPVVRQVQSILRDLGFYSAEPDGLTGPNTRDAVAAYQRKVGLAPTGSIDDALLGQLGAAPAAVVPTPASRNDMTGSVTPAGMDDNARIVKVQAGLRAFGNPDIQLDGIVGARTKAAISEFQSIFGLPVTGEADADVYAKMREVGLTD
ncbi:peptidoglycan-binding domain-containing protein [Aquamicrobium terrae]|uniref:Peptidoglycan hydrolase-like protein with peptidoglycan-binding domain n=1 Tax=Aquamicrobium terrae TaxID=1324945 RepID=A0ABV2MYL5_9HYPH